MEKVFKLNNLFLDNVRLFWLLYIIFIFFLFGWVVIFINIENGKV